MNGYGLTLFLSVFNFFLLPFITAQQPFPVQHEGSSVFYTTGTKNICGNDVLLNSLRKDPAFKAKEEEMNKAILRAARMSNGTPVTLPVVVHIINQIPNSITDLQVMNGIQDLNDAFSNAGAYADSTGVDTGIRFCLSQKDPDGGNTTGITRTTSFFSNDLSYTEEDARLKKLIQWDPLKYINIWLVTNMHGEVYADFSCGIWFRLGAGGYATMPPGGGPSDGIVITGFGKVLAHEMGHYLGLYHTFEGGCSNNDCLISGDRVCDTPPDNSVRASPTCSNPINSCNTDTLSNYSNGNFHTDVPDQVGNFMDYGGSCKSQFSQGQADRMNGVITTQRGGLLQDKCAPPCIENINAAFTMDIAYPLPGDLITFTNTSTVTGNYEWSVNGTVVSTSTHFSFAFNAIGKNQVTLKAFNNPACFASSTNSIIVTCGVTSRFYHDKKTIASKINVFTDSIVFTNVSYHAQGFQWLIRNDKGMAEQVVSTNKDLTFVFPTPAIYSIRLVATSGACSDTTEIHPVSVLDPTPDGVPFGVTLFCYEQTKVKINFCLADYGFAPLPQNTVVNFYDADPKLPGANKLSPTFYLPNPVPGGNCAACFTHIIDVAYQNLEKVYLVFNDAGTSIPVVLPNAPLEEKTYLNNIANSQPINTIVFDSICPGQNNMGHTATGTYKDTIPSSTNGCFSIRTLHLTIKPIVHTTVTASICRGENYAGHTMRGTYVDVYRSSNGCDSTRTLHLTVRPTASAHINASICGGESYFAGGKFQTETGIYSDTAQSFLGCDSIITTYLSVNTLPLPSLGPDRAVCTDEVLTLSPGNFRSYLWHDGSTNSSFTTHESGIYSVLVTNLFCKAADTIKVSFYTCPEIKIPNAFSPNKDGKNDVFRPLIHTTLTNYHMAVWNRWGQPVFETSDFKAGWNGMCKAKEQPVGAYVYVITFKRMNGQEVKKSGTVVLVR